MRLLCAWALMRFPSRASCLQGSAVRGKCSRVVFWKAGRAQALFCPPGLKPPCRPEIPGHTSRPQAAQQPTPVFTAKAEAAVPRHGQGGAREDIHLLGSREGRARPQSKRLLEPTVSGVEAGLGTIHDF